MFIVIEKVVCKNFKNRNVHVAVCNSIPSSYIVIHKVQ